MAAVLVEDDVGEGGRFLVVKAFDARGIGVHASANDGGRARRAWPLS